MIREAKIDDLKELTKLENHINSDKLKSKILNKEIYVLLKENKIIGWLRFSMFWDEHPFMNMLYIVKEYRNKGYGKKLVCFWEERLKEKGYKNFMTSTQSDEEAQHFYRNLGYKDIGGFVLPNEPFELILLKKFD